MPISRKEVLLRARYGWPFQSVEFSTVTMHQPDGYRQDALGYLSMCWDIPLHARGSRGGMNPINMEEWVVEIQPINLLPGDAIGLLGPSSSGPDTAALFEEWIDRNASPPYALTWEMLSDASPGPVRRARPYGHPWRAYRFRDIVD